MSALVSRPDPASAARGGGTTATGTEQTKTRKRIQNRLYQRASRFRNRGNQKPTQIQRQYHVNRWRLDEDLDVYQGHQSAVRADSDITPASAVEIPHHGSSEQEGRRQSSNTFKPPPTATWFPLPYDHLLHLIKYNVFRGFAENKALVGRQMVHYRTPGPLFEPFTTEQKGVFPTYSVILPVVAAAAPHSSSGSLTPTPVQMSIVHSSWIDLLPCPTMRQNLIQQEFEFSHADFIRDLVGTLINLNIFLTLSPPSTSAGRSSTLQVDEDDDGGGVSSSTAETGLIIWGEPYLIGSWEVTPYFLQKWAWAVAGCHELLDSTNYWRSVRGEVPLRLPPTSITTT